MSSCQLFHGPGARQAALDRALEIGRLVAPPFGDEGLNVGKDSTKPPGARDVVELLMSTPVGEKIGVVIIGPADKAAAQTGAAWDVLLKTIEEIPSPYMQPIIWANDLGGVPLTIQSRCLEVWAPGTLNADSALATMAKQVVDQVLANRFSALSGLLKEGGSDDEKTKKVKFQGGDIVWAIAEVLSSDLNDPFRRALWEKIRKVARWSNPTMVEILSALVS